MDNSEATLPPIQVAFHECGHATWAIGRGRTVKKISREREWVPAMGGHCEGFTLIHPDVHNGTEASFEYFLSGIAGEEVGSEIHGYPCNRQQREWEEAAYDLWTRYAYDGRGGAEYDREWFLAKLPPMYEPMLEAMRANPLLPALVAALMEKPVLEEEDLARVLAGINR